jgi:hypothetical protein
MRVGVPYGVHGWHESLAVEFGRELEDNPIDRDRVVPFAVNEEAIALGLRMVDENMAVSLLNADPNSPIYERRRAVEVLAWVAAQEFDILLDFHTTPYLHDSYAAIGIGTSNETIEAAEFLGCENLIVGNFGLPHVYDNVITAEMYAGRSAEERRASMNLWRQKIRELLEYESLADLAEDYVSKRDVDIWSYQGTILLDDFSAVEEQLSQDYADGSFIPIANCDVPLLGVNPVVNGKYYTPHTVACGSFFERLGGAYGEYVFHVGKTDPPDVWRDLARSMTPTDGVWITPDMVLPVKALARQ